MKITSATTAPPLSPAKSQETPPGLAKRDLELPPGIARKLEAGGELPAGIAKRFPIAPPTSEPITTPVEPAAASEGGVDILA